MATRTGTDRGGRQPEADRGGRPSLDRAVLAVVALGGLLVHRPQQAVQVTGATWRS